MDERAFWAVWAVVLLVPFLAIVVSLLFLSYGRARRYSRLDRQWGWLGEGIRYLGTGREWAGVVDGRKVLVDWFDETTEVRVEAQPTLKVGFFRDQPSNVLPAAGEPLPIADGEVAYADQPERVPAVVARPGVVDALRTLLADDGESVRAVEVSPMEGVGWLARDLPDRFGRADTEAWVRALVRLASATEAPAT